MNMKLLCLYTLLLVACSISRGDIIVVYNVDFENPPHVVDQPVVTGVGTDRPYDAAGFVVRDSLADFTTQVASREGGFLSFSPESYSSSGLVRLSWDMAMLTLGPNGPETAAVSVDLYNSGNESWSAITTYFMQDLTIQIAGMNVGAFTLGQQDSFEFLLNMDTGLYDTYLNSSLVLNDQSFGSGLSVANVAFGADFDASPTYAIDNFRWEIIPEPSTLILLILGGLGVAATKKRRYKA
jgi:hypothetical protein